LRNYTEKRDRVTFQVNSKDLSAAIGQKRSNIVKLEKEFGVRNIDIVAGNGMRRREPVLVFN
jgi:transcription antitermination factor NusA-like protein